MTVDAVADLSHYQTSVDLAAMKAGGIDAVILKASQGTTFTDPIFAPRAAAAKAAGLLVGAYHYFDPSADAASQADYFLGIAAAAGVGVLAVDFEPSTAGAGEANAATLCQVLQTRTGRWPLLYTGRWDVNPANPIFSSCPLWIAEWTAAGTPNLPPGWSTWVLWQFESSLNAVPGVVGQSSRSRFNGAAADLQAWWNPAPVAPPPPPAPETATVTVTDGTGAQWSLTGALTRVTTHVVAAAVGAGGIAYVVTQQPAAVLQARPPTPIVAQASVPITGACVKPPDYLGEFEACYRMLNPPR